MRNQWMGATALFLVLAGGTAYAVSQIDANSVKSRHIVNGEVKEEDIANDAVTPRKLGCSGNGPGDVMVRAGSICIDRYENSLWTKRVGGTQITGPIPCDFNGQNCEGKIFARSVKGVPPRSDISWFQAQQALANSGKQLPTSAEWQQAVSGTPDPGGCNVSTNLVANAGASAGCVSDYGANDMVGNLWEWTADWVPGSDACGAWPEAPGSENQPYGSDKQCLAGASKTGEPGALLRGGAADSFAGAGPFAIDATNAPTSVNDRTGFRGVR